MGFVGRVGKCWIDKLLTIIICNVRKSAMIRRVVTYILPTDPEISAQKSLTMEFSLCSANSCNSYTNMSHVIGIALKQLYINGRRQHTQEKNTTLNICKIKLLSDTLETIINMFGNTLTYCFDNVLNVIKSELCTMLTG